MDELTNDNYLLFAVTHYWSIHYTTKEFNSDLKRIIYIKRLLNKYLTTGELSERLILNHLILLYNVFEPSISVNKMLFLKLDKSCFSAIKTFLVYLDRMPLEIYINSSNTILSSTIPIDMEIANVLRTI